jgi:hypothetical protein
MKKYSNPLIVAVFLVTGGLLSGIPVFNHSIQITESASAHRNTAFFISTAQGAENMATLFGVRNIPPVSAVSLNSAPDRRLVFSVTLGAISNISATASVHQDGTSSESVYVSSLSR